MIFCNSIQEHIHNYYSHISISGKCHFLTINYFKIISFVGYVYVAAKETYHCHIEQEHNVQAYDVT